MTENDRILLDEVLEQKRIEIDPEASASDFFEFFTAEQVLKDYDLSYDEIEFGLVADSGDGGIDGIYVFVNDELVREDTELADIKGKTIRIHLTIIQAKTSSGFRETPVERFITASSDIFDLSKDIGALETVYNADVISAIKLFWSVHKHFAARFPLLKVSYFYATKGANPSPSVQHKVGKLREVVLNHFAQAEVAFHFLGASELLQLARKAPQTIYQLELAENPISSSGEVGFVCLVRLRDYYRFITDEKGELRRQLFEANVRDYQGATEVNEEIQQALQVRNPEDFWWLNNGITILAGRASQGAKALTIEDPEVVNGLQTSTEIHNYFNRYNTDGDDRKVLIRVIVPRQSDIRDRVIKANNSQTKVQQASLRATDKIHRDIEEYLRPRGLYYDRRKNFYKNSGKPRERIVGIPQLAQAVMAAALGRPDTARARPSSLLKKDEDYRKVFNPDYPLAVYYVCAEVLRRIENRMKLHLIPAKDRNNLKFYVLMHVTATSCGKRQPEPADLAKIDVDIVSDALINDSLTAVIQKYIDLGGTDQVAKGAALGNAVKDSLGDAETKGDGVVERD